LTFDAFLKAVSIISSLVIIVRILDIQDDTSFCILNVLPLFVVLWDNILLSASPTRNRDNIGQISEVTEPLDIMTNPSKIILSFLS